MKTFDAELPASDRREQLAPNAPPCQCRAEVNAKLKDRGYRISGACFISRLEQPDMDGRRQFGIPLEHADGKRCKAGEASILVANYCPFCGKKA